MTFLYFSINSIFEDDKATNLSLLFKFILSEKLSNSLWGSDVLLFPEFINIVSTLYYNFIEFIYFYTLSW